MKQDYESTVDQELAKRCCNGTPGGYGDGDSYGAQYSTVTYERSLWGVFDTQPPFNPPAV